MVADAYLARAGTDDDFGLPDDFRSRTIHLFVLLEIGWAKTLWLLHPGSATCHST